MSYTLQELSLKNKILWYFFKSLTLEVDFTHQREMKYL